MVFTIVFGAAVVIIFRQCKAHILWFARDTFAFNGFTWTHTVWYGHILMEYKLYTCRNRERECAHDALHCLRVSRRRALKASGVQVIYGKIVSLLQWDQRIETATAHREPTNFSFFSLFGSWVFNPKQYRTVSSDAAAKAQPERTQRFTKKDETKECFYK